MAILLNELSLDGQFSNMYEFLPSLQKIIGCRRELAAVQQPLHCSASSLLIRPVAEQQTLHQVLQQPQFKMQRRDLLLWLTKEGPFWDMPSTHDTEAAYIYYMSPENLVVQTALAEAAHQIEQNIQAATVSFTPSDYQLNPLTVTWYDENKSTEIPNFWELESVLRHVHTWEAPLDSWQMMIDRATERFSQLTFSPQWHEALNGQPFVPAISKRTMELLGILNQLKEHNGRGSQAGRDIYQKFFTGENAIFSDESATNKARFQNELTFSLPSGDSVFCPYHGKIRTQVFRLHFSWPISDEMPLYIVYLGPKITKS